jgi:hypothetical protein
MEEQLRFNRQPHEHILRPNASYTKKDTRSPYWARTRLRKPLAPKPRKTRKHPLRK